MTREIERYRVKLIKRIKTLKNHFRFAQKITGITSAQEDKLRGLIALAHAEIEDYFESIAFFLVEYSYNIWSANKTSNYILTALLIRGKDTEKKLDIGSTIFQKVKMYKDEIINGNNGIKNSNFHKLFHTLGYDDKDFDIQFLAALESFGVLRGSIVHSSANRATSALDKNSIYNKIDEIVDGLISFESIIMTKLQ